jgi:hypothetical protein
MIVDTKQAVNFITTAMKAKLVTMISGSPGIGKSAIVHDIAEQYKLELVDVRLSQCDPVDMMGMPTINEKRASFIPMDLFPLEDTELPKGKHGFLLFLDEFNSASLAVQSASYKLILDKTVGQRKLHKNTVIVCAGNLITNGAIVNRLGTAMQSRLVHLELGVNAEHWTEWASTNKLDHRVISYVHGRPDNLHRFDPNHNDKTFASPRTWEFASRILTATNGTPLRDILPLLAGTIGEGPAREFIVYTETFTRLPSFADIVKNPATAKLDNKSAMLYAISHMIAANVKKHNLPAVMKYTARMPLEFETITLQNILRRDKTLKDEDVIQDWIIEKGDELF